MATPLDLGKTLTAKYGPLPGWAWAGVAAGGLALVLYVRGKPTSTSTTSTTSRSTTASPGATAPAYQPPYLTAPTPSATSSSGTRLRAGSSNPYLTQGGQVSLYQLVNGIMTPVTSVPWGTSISASSAPGTYKYGPNGVSSGVFFPVDSPVPGTYVSADDVSYSTGGTGAGGGIGGGRPAGSRSSRVMHYAHPDVKRAPRFTHFARVGGGAAAHPSTVHSAAARAGVHPARLLMVNPSPRGYLRVA